MSLAAYQTELSSGSKLKLRAKRLLALGRPDEIFEASVLLHEAARKELRAVHLVDVPMATRVDALAEACALYIAARDPVEAGRTYAQLLRLGEVDPTLRRLYEDAQGEYARTLESVELLTSPPWTLRTKRDRARARREAARMTKSFPGVGVWWWYGSRIAEQDGDAQAAWKELARARRLDPENEEFLGLSLIVATRALEAEEARALLVEARARLPFGTPRLCLLYALTELLRSNGDPEEALEAARLGLSKGPHREQRAQLRAAELFAQELLTGAIPSVEQLYLAGLPDLAVRARAGDDLTRLLADSVRQAEAA